MKHNDKPWRLFIAFLVLITGLQPAYVQDIIDPFDKTLPAIHLKSITIGEFMGQIASQTGLVVYCDDDVQGIATSIHLDSMPVRNACKIIMDRCGVGCATDGRTCFVVKLPFDRSAPEQSALDMPIAEKSASPDVPSLLAQASQCESVSDLPGAELLLKKALSKSYQLDGQQGAVYDIVSRLQELYLKQGLSASQALSQFQGDCYLNKQLLRFYRRQAVESCNFAEFKSALNLIDQQQDIAPPKQHNASTAPIFDPSAIPSLSGEQFSGQLAQLEELLFGRNYKDQSVEKRLARLEDQMFNNSGKFRNRNFDVRLANLINAVQLGDSSQNPARSSKKNNWLINPPPVEWLDSFGRGLHKASTAVRHAPMALAEGTGHVLTSPLFWESALLAGAATGGYFALRSANTPSERMRHERSCTGDRNCMKCTNCNSCGHCNAYGNYWRCGQYYLARGLPIPY